LIAVHHPKSADSMSALNAAESLVFSHDYTPGCIGGDVVSISDVVRQSVAIVLERGMVTTNITCIDGNLVGG
jgi:hypothetical protein